MIVIKKTLGVVFLLLAAAGALKVFYLDSGLRRNDGKQSSESRGWQDAGAREGDVLPLYLRGGAQAPVSGKFEDSSVAMAESPDNLKSKRTQDIDQAIVSGKARPIAPAHLSRNYRPDMPVKRRVSRSSSK